MVEGLWVQSKGKNELIIVFLRKNLTSYESLNWKKEKNVDSSSLFYLFNTFLSILFNTVLSNQYFLKEAIYT